MARRELEKRICAFPDRHGTSSHSVREASQRLRSQPGRKLDNDEEKLRIKLPPQTLSQADPDQYYYINGAFVMGRHFADGILPLGTELVEEGKLYRTSTPKPKKRTS